MGIASLVLGIVAIVLGWIPFICFIAFVLAVVGLILGIVDTIKKNKTNDSKRGISIAGLIVSAISIPTIIITCIVSLGLFVAIITDDIEYYNNYYDDYYYDNYDDDFDNYFPRHNRNHNTIDYRDFI